MNKQFQLSGRHEIQELYDMVQNQPLAVRSVKDRTRQTLEDQLRGLQKARPNIRMRPKAVSHKQLRAFGRLP